MGVVDMSRGKLCPCCSYPFLTVLENVGPPHHPESVKMFVHSIQQVGIEKQTAIGCQAVIRVAEHTIQVNPLMLEALSVT